MSAIILKFILVFKHMQCEAPLHAP